jgi:hypothetical protein
MVHQYSAVEAAMLKYRIASFDGDFSEEVEEDDVPPGNDLTQAVFERLRTAGYEVSGFDLLDHYAWGFVMKLQGRVFYVSLGWIEPDEPPEDNPWKLFVDHAPGCLSFRRASKEIQLSALLAIDIALRSVPGISNSRWHAPGKGACVIGEFADHPA